MIKMKSKKGAAAVLLSILFISVVSALSVIYEASARYVSENTVDAVLENAGRVILSCYDRELQEKYGIFGLEMDESGAENGAESLIKATLDYAPSKKTKLEDIKADYSGCSLREPENLKSQITALMKYKALGSAAEMISEGTFAESLKAVSSGISSIGRIKDSIKNREESMKQAEDAQNEQETAGGESESVDFGSIRDIQASFKDTAEDAGKCEEDVQKKDIVLRNGRIKDSLPSAAAGAGSGSAFDGSGTFDYISSGSEGLTSFYENYMIGLYADEYFTNYTSDAQTGFFQNEMEYILYGKMSDKDNRKRAYAGIFALREGLNAAYLFSDEGKKAQALALANELTPGPWSVLTQYIILGAWSALETRNDMKNLYAGNGIPIIKNDSTWAVTLSSVTDGLPDDGFIEISGESAIKYAEYLKILMMTENEEVKLLRIMDLIQINMKGSVRADFMIADHFTGVRLSACANKKSSCPFVKNYVYELVQEHAYKQNNE